MWLLGMNSGPLEEQPVLLTSEPSLQHLQFVLRFRLKNLGLVEHTFYSSTLEEEVGESEFKNSQDYTEKPCLEKQKTKTKKLSMERCLSS